MSSPPPTGVDERSRGVAVRKPPARERGSGAVERLRSRPAHGRLLEAARELAAERGYERLGVGELAARAGVSRQTFYTHFADKRECVAEAVGSELAELAGRLGTAAVRGEAWATPMQEALDETLADLFDSPHSTRGRLIAAMIRLVAEHGYPGTRLVDVIRAAKCSYPAFYRRFPDKQSCFAAAHASLVAGLGDDLALHAPRRDPVKVEGFLVALGETLSCRPDDARVLLLESLALAKPVGDREADPPRSLSTLLEELLFGLQSPATSCPSRALAVGAILETLRAAVAADGTADLPARLPAIAGIVVASLNLEHGAATRPAAA